VTGWYGLSIAALRIATLAVIASAARGFVEFAAWRKSFRNRLIGGEPYPYEVS
jgi:hypothetical protein